MLSEALKKIDEAVSADAIKAVKDELELKIAELLEEAEKISTGRIDGGSAGTTIDSVKTDTTVPTESEDYVSSVPEKNDGTNKVKDAAEEIKNVINREEVKIDEDVKEDAEVVVGTNVIKHAELVELVKDIEVKQDSILAELGVTPEEMAGLLVNEDIAEECLEKTVDAGIINITVDNKSELIVSGNFTDAEHVLRTIVQPQELIGVMSGEQLEIRLVIQQEEEVVTYDELVAALDDDSNIGTKMQINLFRIKNETEWENIAEVSDKIRFVMDISDELVADGRVFELLLSHVHEDGSVEIIRCEDLDSNPNTITCETDRFCDAMLIYKDVKNEVQPDGNNSDVVQDTADENNTVADEETSHFILFNFLALIILLGVVIYEWFGRRKEKYVITALSVVSLIVYLVNFTAGTIRFFAPSSIFYVIVLIMVIACMIVFGKFREQENKK